MSSRSFIANNPLKFSCAFSFVWTIAGETMLAKASMGNLTPQIIVYSASLLMPFYMSMVILYEKKIAKGNLEILRQAPLVKRALIGTVAGISTAVLVGTAVQGKINIPDMPKTLISEFSKIEQEVNDHILHRFNNPKAPMSLNYNPHSQSVFTLTRA